MTQNSNLLAAEKANALCSMFKENVKKVQAKYERIFNNKFFKYAGIVFKVEDVEFIYGDEEYYLKIAIDNVYRYTSDENNEDYVNIIWIDEDSNILVYSLDQDENGEFEELTSEEYKQYALDGLSSTLDDVIQSVVNVTKVVE